MFSLCPRCGCQGFERLKTYAYCVNCNFTEDYEARQGVAIPDWALKALKRKGEALTDLYEEMRTLRPAIA